MSRHFPRTLAFLLAATLALALACSRSRQPLGPADPRTFLQGTTRSDLTTAARTLLASPLRALRIDSTGVTAYPDSAASHVDSALVRLLRSHGIRWAAVRVPESLVVLTAMPHRTLHHYIYSPASLGPPYTLPAAVTQSDFDDWDDLLRIAKVGMDTSPCVRNTIVFEPAIVYPYLLATLGDTLLAALRTMPSAAGITAQQRARVVLAIDRQREANSGFLRHPAITYTQGADFGLRIGATRLGRSSWAVPLLDTLLSQKVIQFAPDHAHLQVSPHLKADDMNRVEWLQLGIMDFVYGNLFEKADPGYDLDLGTGWYYRRE